MKISTMLISAATTLKAQRQKRELSSHGSILSGHMITCNGIVSRQRAHVTDLLLTVRDLFPHDLFKSCQVKSQPQLLKCVYLKRKENKKN